MKSKGFSLAETLVALLLVMLSSSIVVAGIPLARRAFKKVVDSANAEVLLSTTMVVLRDELGMSEILSISSGGDAITYRSDEGEWMIKNDAAAGLVKDVDGTLWGTDGSASQAGVPLVSDGISTQQGMIVKLSGCKYDGTKKILEMKLEVCRSGGSGKALTKQEPYKIRILNVNS